MSSLISGGGIDLSEITASPSDVANGKAYINQEGDLVIGTSDKIYTQAQYNDYGTQRYNAGQASVSVSISSGTGSGTSISVGSGKSQCVLSDSSASGWGSRNGIVMDQYYTDKTYVDTLRSGSLTISKGQKIQLISNVQDYYNYRYDTTTNRYYFHLKTYYLNFNGSSVYISSEITGETIYSYDHYVNHIIQFFDGIHWVAA